VRVLPRLAAALVWERTGRRADGSPAHRGAQTRRVFPDDDERRHHDGREKEDEAEEVVRYPLAEGAGLDFLRKSLTWVCQQLMEAVVSELIGAERGQRSQERLTHRNGYRSRRWQMRAGELELAIPKLRCGSYFSSFLEPRKHSEQALVSVVQDEYVAGVSTRRIDQMVESLSLRVSKSEVSRSVPASTSRWRPFDTSRVTGR
jgi:putative transposase